MPGTRITIDPYCCRSIRGISELKRQVYFGLCGAGSRFYERCQSKQRYDWLVKENGITFGRRLGVVKKLDRGHETLKEDADRPGFIVTAYLAEELAPHPYRPCDELRQDMGGRLDVAAHGHHNAFPEFMGAYVSKAAAELSGAALRHLFTDFDRPAYYELVNEPHWSYWRGEHLAKWHTRTMEVVHERVPGVLVGGPRLSVPYFYKKQYGAHPCHPPARRRLERGSRLQREAAKGSRGVLRRTPDPGRSRICFLQDHPVRSGALQSSEYRHRLLSGWQPRRSRCRRDAGRTGLNAVVFVPTQAARRLWCRSTTSTVTFRATA